MLIQRPTYLNQALDQTQPFKLTPGAEYFVTIADGGSGACNVQFHDGGGGWITYPDDDGSGSQGFVLTAPPDGMVRVNVTAGSVIVSLRPVAPTVIKNE